MAFRINHTHLKASDPRKTADWNRFVRCQSEDRGMNVNISGALLRPSPSARALDA